MIRLCSQAEADQAQNVDTEVSATLTIRDFIKSLKRIKVATENFAYFC